jgi:co-chaperonin GroES (HSP10)
MKITPKKGFVLVSQQDIVEEKKVGTLILPGQEKKKTYLKVESDGEFYHIGDCVFTHTFKGGKMQIEHNLYLVEEADIVASFTLENY